MADAGRHTVRDVGRYAEKLSADEVLKLIDYPAFFELLDKPVPNHRDGMLAGLQAHRLIEPMWVAAIGASSILGHCYLPSGWLTFRACDAKRCAWWFTKGLGASNPARARVACAATLRVLKGW